MSPRVAMASVTHRSSNEHGDSARMWCALSALASAVERLRSCLPGSHDALDDSGRELLEIAAHDVVRALVQARRWTRELERQGIASLDRAAEVLGADRIARARAAADGGRW
ncbi:MAG: hypothetical protein H6697_11045 [Myxococcales bacterium]|nr:hypothetical protein [Myxococcales bacterium]